MEQRSVFETLKKEKNRFAKVREADTVERSLVSISALN